MKNEKFINELFEGLPKLVSTKVAAETIGFKDASIYDMHYRPSAYGAKSEMFVKNGRKLLVRTDLLKRWFISRAA